MTDQLLQLVLSLASILVLGALVRRFWPTQEPLDAARISRALRRNLYFDPVEALMMTADNQSAIARLQNGDIVLVETMGDRAVARAFTPELIKSWSANDEMLIIKTTDYTYPTLNLVFTPEVMSKVALWLQAMEAEQQYEPA